MDFSHVENVHEKYKGNERLSCVKATNEMVRLISRTPELESLEVRSLNTYELVLLRAMGEEQSLHLFRLFMKADDTEPTDIYENFLLINTPDRHQFALAKDKPTGDFYLLDVTLAQFPDRCDEQWYKNLIDKGFTKITDEEFRRYLALRAPALVHVPTINAITLDWAMACIDIQKELAAEALQYSPSS